MIFKHVTLFAGLAFAVDQISKIVIVFGLDLQNIRHIEVFPPYLNFAMGWNRGINFGLFGGGEGARWFLVALSIAICAALVWWVRTQQGKIIHIAIGLIIGGALGNALDRVLYGAVADFLNMSCCGIRNPYTFNVADIFIFAGAGLLIAFSGRDADTKTS